MKEGNPSCRHLQKVSEVKGGRKKLNSRSDRCSIGRKESNLSPPVLAKNKDTVVFRLVPLQGEVSGSVLDFIPILLWSLSPECL